MHVVSSYSSQCFLALFLCAFMAFAAPATAGAAIGEGVEERNKKALADLSPEEVAIVQRVENYLNSLQTLSSRFVQLSDGGETVEGQFYLRRPGRLRLEYDDPVPIVMVTNGLSLLYFDKELRESTYIPLSKTPLWFLIREEVALYEETRIIRAEETKGAVKIELTADNDSLGAKMSLLFSNNPLAFKKWEIVDQQGITTRVALLDPVYNNPIDDEHFSTKDLNLPSRRKKN